MSLMFGAPRAGPETPGVFQHQSKAGFKTFSLGARNFHLQIVSNFVNKDSENAWIINDLPSLDQMMKSNLVQWWNAILLQCIQPWCEKNKQKNMYWYQKKLFEFESILTLFDPSFGTFFWLGRWSIPCLPASLPCLGFLRDVYWWSIYFCGPCIFVVHN